MAEHIGTEIWRAAIPRNPEAAYAFLKDSSPKMLKEFDARILNGYDIGKELSYMLFTRSDYYSLCQDNLTKLEAVALGKKMPTLPLEMVDHGEPGRYAFRRVFCDILKEMILLYCAKSDGRNISDNHLDASRECVKEAYIVMRRFIKHSKR